MSAASICDRDLKHVQKSCRRKLRHTDYLSALLHARSLHDDRMVIYPCEFCHGIHLGHTRLYRDELAKRIKAIRRRIAKHTRLAEEHMQLAHSLKTKLQTLMIISSGHLC